MRPLPLSPDPRSAAERSARLGAAALALLGLLLAWWVPLPADSATAPRHVPGDAVDTASVSSR